MVKGEMGVREALWLGPYKKIMLQRSNAKSINVKKKSGYLCILREVY